MDDGYAILGIHGDDATSTANTARVRYTVGDKVTDVDFQLPPLAGADPTIPPPNYVAQYELAIKDKLEEQLATLQGGSNGSRK